jgi:hypothetical protein
MRYFNIRNLLVGLLIIGLVFLGCSKRNEKEESESAKTETMDEKAEQEFSIHVFIDTTKSAPAKIGAMFLKSSLLEGDYEAATDYLCRSNRETVDWDSLTAFKFEITRRYIPVLAKMNEIRDIKQLYCKDSCLLEYNVAGPLFIKKMFEAALGEGGKQKFDTMADSNISIARKMDFYDHAFERLRFVTDSMDYPKRMDTDTLRLVKEDDGWKVCKQAKSSFDIFRQK